MTETTVYLLRARLFLLERQKTMPVAAAAVPAFRKSRRVFSELVASDGSTLLWLPGILMTAKPSRLAKHPSTLTSEKYQ